LIKKDNQEICRAIAKISQYIRFVAVIGNGGELLAHYRRPDLKPLLDAKDTRY